MLSESAGSTVEAREVDCASIIAWSMPIAEFEKIASRHGYEIESGRDPTTPKGID